MHADWACLAGCNSTNLDGLETLLRLNDGDTQRIRYDSAGLEVVNVEIIVGLDMQQFVVIDWVGCTHVGPGTVAEEDEGTK